MNKDNKINQYIDVMIDQNLYNSRRNLSFMTKTLFDNIEIKDKKVLDIGGGSGLLSFYTSFLGASYVLCLEPESSGSKEGMNNDFENTKNKLNLDNLELRRETLQNSKVEDLFDIVILYNSVNHLDEEACINLRTDANARKKYLNIFQKINSLCKPNAILIISDCSNFNFFPLLKLKNPFVPSIEWNKHQSPKFWSKLLEESGFKEQKTEWNSFNRLDILGKILLGNKLASFFLMSHFTLKVIKN